MSYWAELDADGIVTRVIVADDLDWIVDNLGGTWQQTADPYTGPTEVVYAGPGMGYADNLPNLYAPVWDETAATTPDSDGNWLYTGGEIVWHQGRLWVNVTEGVPNVWEPGVSGWHDAPAGGIPQWVQPTGAHDAYNTGDQVTHNNSVWTSTVDANVWEPGVYGWVTNDAREPSPAMNPAVHVIAVIRAWVDAHPDLADEVLGLELARGDAARVSLVDWLEGYITSRDPP